MLIEGRAETPAVVDGELWVPNISSPFVTRVDPGPPISRADVATGIQGFEPAVTSAAVWVPNRSSGTVTRVDLATEQPTDITIGEGVLGIAADGADVWVTAAGGLFRIVDGQAPATAEAVLTTPPNGGPVVAFGSVWFTSDRQLIRVDPTSGSPTEIPFDDVVSRPVAAQDAIWVQVGNTLVRVGRDGAPAGDPLTFGDGAETLLVAPVEGSLWVAVRGSDPGVYHVDTTTDAVSRPATVTGAPDTPLVVGDRVFVAITQTGPVLELAPELG